MLHKVAAFITRGSGQQQELLVIEHPNAGTQLPAGTVEPDEEPDTAVIREIKEETGLTAVTDQLIRHLYHFRPTRPLPAEWWADPGDHPHASWRLFWLPLPSVKLVQGQQTWLERVYSDLINGVTKLIQP